MKHSPRYLLLLLLLVSSAGLARAQSNILFYHSDGFYNAADYNPAKLTEQKEFTVNIFPLSGMGFSYNNYDAVDKIRKILFNEEINDKSKEIFRSLIKKDLSYNYLDINLFNIGINGAYGALNFQVKEKAYVLMRYGGSFSRFLMDTLSTETVRLNELQHFPTEAMHFREYSLGYANELVPKILTVGARLKLYYGKSFTTSDVSGRMIEKEGAFYAKSSGSIILSAPASDNGTDTIPPSKINLMDGKSVSDYVFNTGNKGLGIDLGMSWKINPQLTFTVSVLDLGKISWKKYLYKLDFDEGLYEIENIRYNPQTEQLEKETDEVDLIDNISSLYEITDSPETYTTRLPTTCYAGLNYQVHSQLSIGIVNRYIYEKKMGHNSFSALANYRASERLTIVGGLGVYGTSLKNLPVGLLYSWRAAQFHLGTDNLLSPFVPKFSDYCSFTFGVDLNLFGPKVRYKQVDYLPFFKLKRIKRKRSNGLIFRNPY
ncbi:DUF5723 family protein [Mangrovibacterium marinum]|uniref:DUF5723 family protein n=1 Tax=Mangrovibacterium marinum TaxID=1639118 RepID=UPI0011B28DA6|nr:DUF5723 family protein [Mangrovibacterium marinum]